MLIYMSANILRFFVFGLFLGLTVAFAAEPLPVVVVKPHAVDLAFPAESLVEAVQQAVVVTAVREPPAAVTAATPVTAGRAVPVAAAAGPMTVSAVTVARVPTVVPAVPAG